MNMVTQSSRKLLLAMALAMPALVFAEKPNSNRWAKSMEAFASQDSQKPVPPGGVVFVGSSSIRLWDLQKSFADVELSPLNRGFGGSELEDSIRHIELLVLKHKPSMVVVYAGDNDIARGKSAVQVSEDFSKLVKLIRGPFPETKIAFIAIKPSLARWKLADEMQKANNLIAKQCDMIEGLQFIDIWKPMLAKDGRPRSEFFQKDGLHLNDRGYELWNSMVRPVVEQKGTEAAQK